MLTPSSDICVILKKKLCLFKIKVHVLIYSATSTCHVEHKGAHIRRFIQLQ